MKKHFLLPLSLLFFSCKPQSANSVANAKSPDPLPIVNQEGNTIQERFKTPAGFERVSTNAFGLYLRKLPLQPDGSKVHYYNGAEKNKAGVYCAVVKMDIGSTDLQQCADAVMRLRAEYLLRAGLSDKIHFTFTNGFIAAYSKWKEGYRIQVNGNNTSWVQTAAPSDSYTGFRNYMDKVFSYAGTMSLSKELKEVPYRDMQPGDVLVKGGAPGHAVIVVDMAKNKNGKKFFMIAQSYMPAQEIQVLQNPSNPGISPWYELDEAADGIILTPEWQFYTSQLKRFAD